MAQDSSKSVVYRSFFTCDDPKGVAECNTMRKSKLEIEKSDYMLEKKDKQKDPIPMIKVGEINIGAKKLNQHAIDNSRYNGNISHSHRQCKDVAKHLLRGALDLQESLEMLGKLQEASQYMENWKRNQTEKAKHGVVGGIHGSEFQKPRLSADGSSKDCYEELREAIREGLAKQNLLPKSSSGENAYIRRSKSFGETKYCKDKSKLGFSIDFPSTSPSQSSMCHLHEFEASKSFDEKPKVPNVVARLMGLEENHSKTSPLTLEMQLRKNKRLNYKKPFLDIDFPKARKSCHINSSVQKVDSGERKFDKLIHTVRYKGRWLADDVPPIVIIKPRHFNASMEEDPYKHLYFCDDLDPPKEIVRKSKTKVMVHRIPSNIDKKGSLNISEIKRRLQTEMNPLNTGLAKEVEITKVRGALKHHNMNTSKTKSKSFRKSDLSKDESSPQKATNFNLIEDKSHMAPPQMKAKFENSVPIQAPTLHVEIQLDNVVTQNNQSPETEDDFPVTKTVVSEKLVRELPNDAFQCLVDCNLSKSDLIDYTSPIIDNKCNTVDHNVGCITDNPTEKESYEEKSSKMTRRLLLDSDLFLNKLDTVFHTSTCTPVVSHTNSIALAYHKKLDPKHLIDCGKELLEYKNQQCMQAVQPWSRIFTNKLMIHIDVFVDEICEGIEDLRNYQNLDSKNFAGDSGLRKVLEKDLCCKGLVSGGWDYGWRNVYTHDEVEQIVLDIEHAILCGITSDALEDMLN